MSNFDIYVENRAMPGLTPALFVSIIVNERSVLDDGTIQLGGDCATADEVDWRINDLQAQLENLRGVAKAKLEENRKHGDE